MLFWKKTVREGYDPQEKTPMIRASICTGEQVVGFRDLRTGKFEEIQLIRNAKDLEEFKKRYGISGEIKKFY